MDDTIVRERNKQEHYTALQRVLQAAKDKQPETQQGKVSIWSQGINIFA